MAKIMMHALQYNLMGKEQKCQGSGAAPLFHYGADRLQSWPI